MTCLLRQLSEQKAIGGSSEFKELNPNKHHCVRCSHKTQAGFLFPLMKSVIFVTRPVIWIRYDDIEGITFGLGQMLRSSFDLIIRVKRQAVFEFSQIERPMLAPLCDFLRNREVPIDNLAEVQNMIQGIADKASRTRGRESHPGPDLGRSGAKATGASRSAGSRGRASAQEAGSEDPYEEGEDEDYEDDDAEGSESSDDEPDEEEPQQPQKRPR